MRESLKKLTAFTLSEVLITLGIIGVVSTLTLPNLTNSYRRNVAMTKIEKGYAQLAQAYEQMLTDHGGDTLDGDCEHAVMDEDPIVDNATGYFNRYWRPYLKSPILCTTAADCGYSNSDNGLFGAYSDYSFFDKESRAMFMTNEGIVYNVNFCRNTNQGTDNRAIIYMDINGGKSPNVLGRDIFVIQKAGDDGLMPYGYNLDKYYVDQYCLTNDINNDSNIGGEMAPNSTCLEYLRRRGWEAPRNYQF